MVDAETAALLRKRWITRDISGSSDRRLKATIDDLLSLRIIRYPTGPLMIRAYELRANVTAHDAAYVALAEGLDCTLLTADSRLSRAPAITCQIECFTT